VERKAYTRENKDIPHYSSVCPTAEKQLANIHKEGDARYGIDNWTVVEDLEKFRRDVFDHAREHMNLYLLGDRSENHLAKVMWGMAALIHHDTDCQHHDTIKKEPRNVTRKKNQRKSSDKPRET